MRMLRIKKYLCAALTLVMLVSVSACGKEGKNSGKTLYEQGLEVASLMVEATQTEKYVEIYAASPNLEEVVKEIGEGDYTVPEAVYTITIKEEVLSAISELGNMGDVSETLKDTIIDRVFGSLITRINGLGGVTELAASGICTMGKTFVDKSVTDNVTYIYVYEDALPIAVTFTVGEDGSVSASGNFIMYEGFNCGSVEEIQEAFRALGMEVSVEEY